MTTPGTTGTSEPARGYRHRQHAGHVLAEQLTRHPLTDPLVLGLARGGVPVAAEVARALGADLRVTVARKIGAPGQPELALGAVTAHGPATFDPRLLQAFHLDEQTAEQLADRERAECRAREQRYGQDGPAELADRDAVLVDDGLATGATARAAVRMLREQQPRAVLLAVPVGAPDAVRALQHEADAVVCPLQPAEFAAVGQYYRDFAATGDAEIDQLLAEHRSTGKS